MPLYMCNSVSGAISDVAKAKIARDITDIHCEITGAPSTFVHAFFLEDAPQQPLNGKSVFLFGNIRQGRTVEQKSLLLNRLKGAIECHAGIPAEDILADLAEIPASWVMEGSDVLPEPGDEREWFNERDAAGKLACPDSTATPDLEN